MIAPPSKMTDDVLRQRHIIPLDARQLKALDGRRPRKCMYIYTDIDYCRLSHFSGNIFLRNTRKRETPRPTGRKTPDFEEACATCPSNDRCEPPSARLGCRAENCRIHDPSQTRHQRIRCPMSNRLIDCIYANGMCLALKSPALGA